MTWILVVIGLLILIFTAIERNKRKEEKINKQDTLNGD